MCKCVGLAQAQDKKMCRTDALWQPFNPTADCGALPPPTNGFVQPHTNTTEGSVVVFQCDPGFVPEGVMTAVCGRDGQWTPNPGGVTCSPRPTHRFTQTFIQPPTHSSTPHSSTPTGHGENERRTACYYIMYKLKC